MGRAHPGRYVQFIQGQGGRQVLGAEEHELMARKRDYEAPSMTVEVDRETTVEIQTRRVPETNPDEEDVWM